MCKIRSGMATAGIVAGVMVSLHLFAGLAPAQTITFQAKNLDTTPIFGPNDLRTVEVFITFRDVNGVARGSQTKTGQPGVSNVAVVIDPNQATAALETLFADVRVHVDERTDATLTGVAITTQTVAVALPEARPARRVCYPQRCYVRRCCFFRRR